MRLGSRLPFAQAAEVLGSFWGVFVSPDTVRRATERAGAAGTPWRTRFARGGPALAAVEERELCRLERELPLPPPGPAVLQWSMDGAFVPLVHGEWAEVKTAAIGVVGARVGKDGAPEAHAAQLSYCSRLADAAFGRLVRLDVHRRGLQTAGLVAAVGDGALWIQGIVALYRPDALRILDFPHAVGHLAAAAQATFTADPAALAALAALPTHEAADPAAAAAAQDATLGYREARLPMLAYPDFVAKGLPIGSGEGTPADQVRRGPRAGRSRAPASCSSKPA